MIQRPDQSDTAAPARRGPRKTVRPNAAAAACLAARTKPTDPPCRFELDEGETPDCWDVARPCAVRPKRPAPPPPARHCRHFLTFFTTCVDEPDPCPPGWHHVLGLNKCDAELEAEEVRSRLDPLLPGPTGYTGDLTEEDLKAMREEDAG